MVVNFFRSGSRFLVLLFVFAPLVFTAPAVGAGMKSADFPRGAVSPEQGVRLLKSAAPESFLIVDVRQAEAFEESHLPGAVSLPFDELEARLDELPADKPVLFTCQTGSLAAEAYDLARRGRPEIRAAYIKARVSFPDGKNYHFSME